MSVRSGSRLGPYEIVDLLGAGGMGEVYRARDTRLDRLVALKVLPDVLSEDASSRVRFEREAKAISALNHPHICALHDVGRADGTEFLVLELLDGETLAARLARGALPLAQVLRIGSETADALGAAHRQGIIHRDLKPANVMLTSRGVKLLDFGLAKPRPIQMSEATITAGNPTAQGTIVGTLQYMAPEQLQGQDTDARSDIFALGAILYEMATGRRAFDAASHATLIARILDTEPPPVSTLLPLAPAAFDQLVQRCLAKDPVDRWQSAHDLALQLRGMQTQISGVVMAPAASRRRPRIWPWIPWAVAGLSVAAAVVSALWPRTAVTDDAPPIRLEVRLPVAIRMDFDDGPHVSPDGRLLAYPAIVNGRRQLSYIDLASQQTVTLLGTDGAESPFWSPDSRSLGFFTSDSLKVVSLASGQARTLAPAAYGGGGTWGDGFILFAPTRSGIIHRIADTGGKAEPLALPPLPKSGGYIWPYLLPDGKTFLVKRRELDRGDLQAVSLEAPGNPKTILKDSDRAQYQRGHLVYNHGGALGARAFDARRLEFSGPFVPLRDGSLGRFSVARTGLIVYRLAQPRQLTWITRDGARPAVLGEAAHITSVTVSPSGRRAIIWHYDTPNIDLWNVDLTTGITSRLTSDPALDFDPVWSPDERTLAFGSLRLGRAAVYLKHLADGKEELLFQHPDDPITVDSWTPDGKFVVAHTPPKAVYLIPVTGDRTPRLLLDTPDIDEDELQVSPDGRWVVFNSNESGRWEVYLARFPDFTSKRQISSAGGIQPHWRADGRELFYLAPNGSMMSVRVTPGPEPTTDPPAVLFTTSLDANGNYTQYDVMPDGKRFLALERGEHRGHTFGFLINFLKSQ